MAHVHADSMALYAQDAAETDKPWERWECRYPENDPGKRWSRWMDMREALRWHKDYEYRRKLKTININGHETPEPYRGPMKLGQKYWIVDFSCPSFAYECDWHAGDTPAWRMDAGIVHLNKVAAEAHGRALASFAEAPDPTPTSDTGEG